MTLSALLAGNASAQSSSPGQPPVLDMRRLYQIVGYYHNLDPDLLEAIATAESNNNPAAVSPKGAQGLMQLMPGTARQYRVDHPFDPVENAFGAARLLCQLRAWSELQASYGEVDLPAMIAAYNAGPHAVEKYGGIPPYAETQAYVRKVLWLYLLGHAPPRAVVLAHPPGRREKAAKPPKLASVTRRAANGAPGKVQTSSALDKLADIRRQREEAKAHDLAARNALHIN